ncbi:hypothetical protein RJ641_020020 [Dillenia turbinata]|uniref:Uncharacterized protein n=1 Tax=Dillenia turbinata TaxID=194707 RepID=A0AAN8UDP1_9MAGN
MCIISWCNSGHEDIRRCRKCICNRLMTAGLRSKGRVWRVLWRRVKKERKRLFECSVQVEHVPYDPYTYSQNFDQGSLWTDPDFLSRSFSASEKHSKMLQRFNQALMDLQQQHLSLHWQLLHIAELSRMVKRTFFNLYLILKDDQSIHHSSSKKSQPLLTPKLYTIQECQV